MEGIQCSLKLPGKSENSHLVTLVVFPGDDKSKVGGRHRTSTTATKGNCDNGTCPSVAGRKDRFPWTKCNGES
jgi:hypothetical protein